MREVVAMTKTYRVTPFVRMGNLFTRTMIRSGLRVRNSALLTVTGRKSGKPRTVPIAVAEYEGQRYLIGAFGNVNWVRNLRAAGEATLTYSGTTEQIIAIELSPERAAPILKDVLASAPGFVRSYFSVAPDAPLADFVREAPRHPVFQVATIADWQAA
jgi:deazaflavin-dependent oxidoreductase (nitroreductase family)